MSDAVEFKLLGKDYRVACTTDDKASLLQAAALLEARLKEAGGAKPGANVEKIAMMVALNLAHDVVIRQAGSGDVRPPLDGEKIRRMIGAIESRLDESLAELDAGS